MKQEFKFGDKVKIKDEFFINVAGVVVDYIVFMFGGSDSYSYQVLIGEQKKWFEAKDLEKDSGLAEK